MVVAACEFLAFLFQMNFPSSSLWVNRSALGKNGQWHWYRACLNDGNRPIVLMLTFFIVIYSVRSLSISDVRDVKRLYLSGESEHNLFTTLPTSSLDDLLSVNLTRESRDVEVLDALN